MRYRDLIHKTKALAGGAKEDESEDALEVVVETVASNLTDYTRNGFAARLPEELQDAAHTAPTLSHLDMDIVEQLMDLEDLDEHRARRILKAAWRALIEHFDSDSVDDIRAELPQHVRAILR